MRRLFLLAFLWAAALGQGVVLEDDLVQELHLAPGQEALLALALRNEGKSPARVRVEVADYREGEGFLPPGTLGRSLAPGLSPESWEVFLPPGERTVLRVRVRVPGDLEGTRYAYLLLTPEAEEEARAPKEGVSVGVQIVRRYAVLVAVTHGGRPEVRFRESRLEEGRLVFLGENAGSRLYRPRARYQVVGPQGVVAQGELGTFTFLPGNPKSVAVPLPALAPGSYQVLLFLDDGEQAYAVRARLSR